MPGRTRSSVPSIRSNLRTSLRRNLCSLLSAFAANFCSIRSIRCSALSKNFMRDRVSFCFSRAEGSSRSTVIFLYESTKPSSNANNLVRRFKIPTLLFDSERLVLGRNGTGLRRCKCPLCVVTCHPCPVAKGCTTANACAGRIVTMISKHRATPAKRTTVLDRSRNPWNGCSSIAQTLL